MLMKDSYGVKAQCWQMPKKASKREQIYLELDRKHFCLLKQIVWTETGTDHNWKLSIRLREFTDILVSVYPKCCVGYSYTQVLFVTYNAHLTGPPGFPLVPYPEATSVETSMLPQPGPAVPMVGGWCLDQSRWDECSWLYSQARFD